MGNLLGAMVLGGSGGCALRQRLLRGFGLRYGRRAEALDRRRSHSDSMVAVAMSTAFATGGGMELLMAGVRLRPAQAREVGLTWWVAVARRWRGGSKREVVGSVSLPVPVAAAAPFIFGGPLRHVKSSVKHNKPLEAEYSFDGQPFERVQIDDDEEKQGARKNLASSSEGRAVGLVNAGEAEFRTVD